MVKLNWFLLSFNNLSWKSMKPELGWAPEQNQPIGITTSNPLSDLGSVGTHLAFQKALLASQKKQPHAYTHQQEYTTKQHIALASHSTNMSSYSCMLGTLLAVIRAQLCTTIYIGKFFNTKKH